MSSISVESERADRQRFLRFPLNSQIDCLLQLENLKGVINVKTETILPVPQVAEYWLGIINWRGEAIWILNLANLISDNFNREQNIIPKMAVAMLVEDRHSTVGILVEQLSAIESYNLEEILPISSTMLTSKLCSFLQGYFLDSEQQPLMVLDIESTLQGTLKN